MRIAYTSHACVNSDSWSANGDPFWSKTVTNAGPKQAIRSLDFMNLNCVISFVQRPFCAIQLAFEKVGVFVVGGGGDGSSGCCGGAR